MKSKLLIILSIAVILSACSKPEDIVLGSEPLKTLDTNSDLIKKLPEEERKLLFSYIAYKNIIQNKDQINEDSIVGLTVGETLKKAKTWKAAQEEKLAEQKRRQQEAEALKAKIQEDRKQISEKIANLVTVAVTGKEVLNEDIYARRFDDELLLKYAIENKSAKDIRLLKGRMYFYDATGDELGWLPLTFQEKINAGKILKTDTNRVWRIRSHGPGEIKKIANASFDGMTTKFQAESISFTDGEVIKTPE